jgi:L-ascorbate metabolism protein UlaG (beta-lactamase superfamily)
MRVRTIVHDFDGIPEAAFVVDVDGITIFHSGDHGNGPPPFRQSFVENLEYVAAIAPSIDLAFIPLWGEESFVVETLRPKYTFPMHDLGREHQYALFADRAKSEGLPTEVIAAAARGDQFILEDGSVRVSLSDRGK